MSKVGTDPILHSHDHISRLLPSEQATTSTLLRLTRCISRSRPSRLVLAPLAVSVITVTVMLSPPPPCTVVLDFYKLRIMPLFRGRNPPVNDDAFRSHRMCLCNLILQSASFITVLDASFFMARVPSYLLCRIDRGLSMRAAKPPMRPPAWVAEGGDRCARWE